MMRTGWRGGVRSLRLAPRLTKSLPVWARANEADEVAPVFERESEPQLVPVAASVFDDAFFRKDVGCGGASHWGGATDAVGTGSADPVTEPAREVRLFAGAAAVAHAEPAESDELDIPAFLRRSR